MKKINISAKTFDLYKRGERTFIHVFREKEYAFVEELKFGEEVILLNKESKEEFKQTFWFLYKPKRLPRFYVLVFKWNKENSLFFKRKAIVQSFSDRNGREINHNRDQSVPDQFISISALMAYSAFFFIDSCDYFATKGDHFSIVSVVKSYSKNFFVTNVLNLKAEDTDKSEIIYVMSLFPMSLF